MTEELFTQALGIESPWYVSNVAFDTAAGELTIAIDFARGSRFPVSNMDGSHPVYDTEEHRYRHLNFFQHTCMLVVRVPRVELPDGTTRTVTPPWAGRLRGFTLLMEAYVFLLVSQGMTFAEAARTVGVSAYQVKRIVVDRVEEAVDERSLSAVRSLAIDETSRARGHAYITVAADTDRRCVIDIQEGRGSRTIGRVVETLERHGGSASSITDVCIDMSHAYRKGVADHLPDARVTIDTFHVVWQATMAVDITRRREQKRNRDLKGMRWLLVKGYESLRTNERERLDTMVRYRRMSGTARAWCYKEELRALLKRRQPNVVREHLVHWCRRVQRSMVDAMKPVARLVLRHLDAIVNWTRSRITNGFLESLHGQFQAAKRKARGFRDIRTIRAVYFLLAGKLDFKTTLPTQLPT